MTEHSTAPALPVTVSVTRHVDPAHSDEIVAWIQAGFSLAQRFPGFLGSGWVRPSTGSDEWHMLYRFDSATSLADWEASSQRRWWLDSAQGLVGESRKEQRTGIEGWFDPPQERDVEDLRPLSLLVSYLFGVLAPDAALLPRVLISTLLMTPVMTYVVLPQLTRRLEWWLHGRPAPWRP